MTFHFTHAQQPIGNTSTEHYQLNTSEMTGSYNPGPYESQICGSCIGTFKLTRRYPHQFVESTKVALLFSLTDSIKRLLKFGLVVQ